MCVSGFPICCSNPGTPLSSASARKKLEDTLLFFFWPKLFVFLNPFAAGLVRRPGLGRTAYLFLLFASSKGGCSKRENTKERRGGRDDLFLSVPSLFFILTLFKSRELEQRQTWHHLKRIWSPAAVNAPRCHPWVATSFEYKVCEDGSKCCS